jgi:hypothetical protein
MDASGGISPLGFFLGAGVLLGLSVILFHNTEPYSLFGPSYETKRKKRLIAKVLLIIASLCLCIAAVGQIIAVNR